MRICSPRRLRTRTSWTSTACGSAGISKSISGQKLPFDLAMTYMREVKSGYRGNGGGVVYSEVNSIVELPQSLNEVTQDFGLRAAVNKSWGNVYAAFAHNWYNDRQETTVFDNPLRPSDLAYVSSSAPARAVPDRAV